MNLENNALGNKVREAQAKLTLQRKKSTRLEQERSTDRMQASETLRSLVDQLHELGLDRAKKMEVRVLSSKSLTQSFSSGPSQIYFMKYICHRFVFIEVYILSAKETYHLGFVIQLVIDQNYRLLSNPPPHTTHTHTPSPTQKYASNSASTATVAIIKIYINSIFSSLFLNVVEIEHFQTFYIMMKRSTRND